MAWPASHLLICQRARRAVAPTGRWMSTIFPGAKTPAHTWRGVVGCHDCEVVGYEFALGGRAQEAKRTLEAACFAGFLVGFFPAFLLLLLLDRPVGLVLACVINPPTEFWPEIEKEHS